MRDQTDFHFFGVTNTLIKAVAIVFEIRISVFLRPNDITKGDNSKGLGSLQAPRTLQRPSGKGAHHLLLRQQRAMIENGMKVDLSLIFNGPKV